VKRGEGELERLPRIGFPVIGLVLSVLTKAINRDCAKHLGDKSNKKAHVKHELSQVAKKKIQNKPDSPIDLEIFLSKTTGLGVKAV